jgi:hypothetical protein
MPASAKPLMSKSEARVMLQHQMFFVFHLKHPLPTQYLVMGIDLLKLTMTLFIVARGLFIIVV